MKKIRIIISIMLVLSLLCVCTAQAFAVEENDVLPEEKISNELKEKMAEAEDDELIPVWIWYEDVNQDSIDELTERQTGFSAEECSVIKEALPAGVITQYSDDSDEYAEELKTYIERTENDRSIEESRTQNYIETHRSIAAEKYNEKSSAVLQATRIFSESVLFKSEFAPMFVAELTADKIRSVAENSSVEEINLFVEREEQQEEQEDTIGDRSDPNNGDPAYNIETLIENMGLEEVYDRLDLTGEGVKIGLVEGNLPGIIYNDNDTYSIYGFDSDNIAYVTYANQTEFDNIAAIVENQISNFNGSGPIKVIDIASEAYQNWMAVQPTEQPTEQSTEPWPYPHSHANTSVRIMVGDHIGIAKDARVYAGLSDGDMNKGPSVLGTFASIEVLIKCGVNVLLENVEIRTSTLPDNIDDNKYFDHIVYNHHIAVVVPGGNDYDQGETGQWVNPLGLSYNAITVGSYSVDGATNSITETLEEYKWQNNNGSNLYYCEKPDVVLPDNYGSLSGTSLSAPAMTAIIALMYELKPSLKALPHVMKAIILASCHRKAEHQSGQGPTETMEEGITERQGAGIPDAWIMSQIIIQNTYAFGNINSGMNYNVNVIMNPTQPYYLNFCTAWLRKTAASNNHFELSDITLYSIANIDLHLLNNNNVESELTYSSTEMCYFLMPNQSATYSFNIANLSNINVDYIACAWSTSDRGKELHHIELNGKTAVGQTLLAKGYCNDGTQAPVGALNYQWKRSSNGTTWTNISGATSSSYTLSSSDFMRYIKCIATPKNTSIVTSTAKSAVTNLKIIRYGDADSDGAVKILDVTRVLRYVSNLVTLTNEEMVAADVDGDGDVTSLDAVLIQNYVSGTISSFPVES